MSLDKRRPRESEHFSGWALWSVLARDWSGSHCACVVRATSSTGLAIPTAPLPQNQRHSYHHRVLLVSVTFSCSVSTMTAPALPITLQFSHHVTPHSPIVLLPSGRATVWIPGPPLYFKTNSEGGMEEAVQRFRSPLCVA